MKRLNIILACLVFLASCGDSRARVPSIPAADSPAAEIAHLPPAGAGISAKIGDWGMDDFLKKCTVVENSSSKRYFFAGELVRIEGRLEEPWNPLTGLPIGNIVAIEYRYRSGGSGFTWERRDKDGVITEEGSTSGGIAPLFSITETADIARLVEAITSGSRSTLRITATRAYVAKNSIVDPKIIIYPDLDSQVTTGSPFLRLRFNTYPDLDFPCFIGSGDFGAFRTPKLPSLVREILERAGKDWSFIDKHKTPDPSAGFRPTLQYP